MQIATPQRKFSMGQACSFTHVTRSATPRKNGNNAVLSIYNAKLSASQIVSAVSCYALRRSSFVWAGELKYCRLRLTM